MNPKGTAIIVPGPFASVLTAGPGMAETCLWPEPLAVSSSRFAELMLPDADGRDVVAPRPIPCYYSLLEMGLSRDGYATEFFAYDWRRDLDEAAKRLRDTLRVRDGPIRLVAHSTASMVVRRAAQFWGEYSGTDRVRDRLAGIVLIGPSNYGSLAAALALLGAVHLLPPFDVMPSPPEDARKALSSFPSLYQSLPWQSGRLNSLDDADHDLRNLDFWRGMIDQELFRKYMPRGEPPWAATIDSGFMADRTAIILGDAPTTPGGLLFRGGRPSVGEQCNVPGDGFIPRTCSLLDERPATWVASGIDHLRLPLSEAVILGTIDLLAGREPAMLGRYRQ